MKLLCPNCGNPLQAVHDHKLEELYLYCPRCKRTVYDGFDVESITVEDLIDAA